MRCIFVAVFVVLMAPSFGQSIPAPRFITHQEAVRISQSVQRSNPPMYGSSHFPPYHFPTGGSKSKSVASLSKKYEFTVVLKIDSTFTSKTSIDLSNEEEMDYHKIAVKRSKKDKQPQVYYPIDTKSITRLTEDGQKLVGIPVDSCWLFKTASGKINSYSFLAEPETKYIIAIQQGDHSPIVPLTKKNLSGMVGTEPKVQKLIEKNELVEALVLYNKN